MVPTWGHILSGGSYSFEEQDQQSQYMAQWE